jgi:hypothetical protein
LGLSLGCLLALFATGSQITSDEDDNARYTDGGEHEPLHRVPEVWALGELRQLDGLEAALLLRLHGQQADVAPKKLDTAA